MKRGNSVGRGEKEGEVGLSQQQAPQSSARAHTESAEVTQEYSSFPISSCIVVSVRAEERKGREKVRGGSGHCRRDEVRSCARVRLGAPVEITFNPSLSLSERQGWGG